MSALVHHQLDQRQRLQHLLSCATGRHQPPMVWRSCLNQRQQYSLTRSHGAALIKTCSDLFMARKLLAQAWCIAIETASNYKRISVESRGCTSKMPKLRIIVVIIFTLLLHDSCPERHTLEGVWINLDTSLLRTGDIIFRRGNSLLSQYVSSQDPGSSFTHSGIMLINKHGAFVVHITTGEPPEMLDKARVEPLQSFLSTRKASAAGVYRLHSNRTYLAQAAAQRALAFVEKGVVFDIDFDHSSPNQLYCTELVYRSYKEAGIDLVEDRFQRLSIPFMKIDRFILPSSIINSPHLSPVLSTSQH